jgi:hypothetical protein
MCSVLVYSKLRDVEIVAVTRAAAEEAPGADPSPDVARYGLLQEAHCDSLLGQMER